MNSTLNLLRHAFGLVTTHPAKTVKVIAPAILMMGGVGLLTAALAPELLAINPSKPDLTSITSVNLALVLLTTFILSYALMAILWHRHTLGPTHAPRPMSAPLILGYLWRVIVLAIIQLVVGLVLVLPLIAAGQEGETAANPSTFSMLLTTFLTQLLLVWLSLRLSLILPAAALGRAITMRHSWQRTQSVSRMLWGVAAALAFINTTFAALIALVSPSTPEHMLALELPIYIIEGLLIFSVLTTLYARQIQQGETGTP
ncbi:hypothetical protein [Sulfitobacter donghicola]|uniref:Glycerophosphoryl diester phosphodiesterase membrane domain-containing protein n=1 Tax=Sulfitobacter donghicola DSW-25 = KCTC 12864 = JCM 14565 TaxID=1300350 RepID=A0A073IJ94_9RHOB|nr:hypothetical protein [Sulfitobacter donghicola]KEJ89650.1 hypothetical protein DSW25_10045 [Sulfitobacter donghicola DSW-25 = KCTC 12864 = JCM 14565]KIN69156.1 hypothetical protein Z948_2895 [Sulfitobacter donghicola DSW-25 = KCTC 12864 = JCM 14565]